jgi:hypothetical protein
VQGTATKKNRVNKTWLGDRFRLEKTRRDKIENLACFFFLVGQNLVGKTGLSSEARRSAQLFG